MREEKITEFGQRMDELTQLLAHISLQLSAATKMVMLELPRAMQEFNSVRELAVELGIETSRCPEEG